MPPKKKEYMGPSGVEQCDRANTMNHIDCKYPDICDTCPSGHASDWGNREQINVPLSCLITAFKIMKVITCCGANRPCHGGVVPNQTRMLSACNHDHNIRSGLSSHQKYLPAALLNGPYSECYIFLCVPAVSCDIDVVLPSVPTHLSGKFCSTSLVSLFPCHSTIQSSFAVHSTRLQLQQQRRRRFPFWSATFVFDVFSTGSAICGNCPEETPGTLVMTSNNRVVGEVNERMMFQRHRQ
ncbi:hypothetical protein F2P81_009249 [Scophthalmus maximus]|uniref:Uncharacterized protein n=1 Tax=Scophthalmus maximus TaxID=52904 RepID=A0A6A4T129_SCOMX|nr:hypothetical protein F2P81_009249 [Scophthalmus maximus]